MDIWLCLPSQSHTTLRGQVIPSFPSWLRDEGRSLHLMMGGEFLAHLYCESPVFFQIQPGNLEKPVGTDKCAIAYAWTLESSNPCFHVIYLFAHLLVFLRDESRDYLLLHFILGSLQGNWQSVLGREGQKKPYTSYMIFWIGPLWLPVSWCFGGSFEWEPQNCFAVLIQESWDRQCQTFPKWSPRPWSSSEIKI